MKKILLVLVSLLLCFNVNSYAQLKVKGSTSKVIIGPDRITVGDDQDNVLKCSIFGDSLDPFRPGAKLGFGDFGIKERNGWNVFIGEFGERDSDKFWLHGKNGFNFTISNADLLNHEHHMLMSYDVSNSLGLKVNTEILAQGFKIPAKYG